MALKWRSFCLLKLSITITFIDVKQCEAKGVFVNAEIEGRIVEQ